MSKTMGEILETIHKFYCPACGEKVEKRQCDLNLYGIDTNCLKCDTFFEMKNASPNLDSFMALYGPDGKFMTRRKKNTTRKALQFLS